MTTRSFRDERLLGASFDHVDLSGSRFERVDFGRATFRSIDFDGADIRNASLLDVTMRGVELRRVEIWGELGDVRVNGIDIAPLIEAELTRLHPERPRLHPTDAAGYREAWEVIDALWTGTVERARQLAASDPDLLHESVDGEWSFIQTVRHLAFATTCWLSRGIERHPAPWHPLELPWDEMPPTEGVPHDRDARPTLDLALDLRRDRFERVRTHLASLTDADLAGANEVPDTPGWPPAGDTVPVTDALGTLLNEEWWHRQFAERDLTALEARLTTNASTRHTEEKS